MSTPISLGDGMTLKIKYRNGRAFASVIQHGRLLGRTLPITFLPLLGLEREITDDRQGYHVIRQTTTKEYKDSPVQSESRLILARFDGERFLYVSPNQVGRESGAAVDLNRANTRYARLSLPFAIKRFLLSYPNAPEHQRTLATFKLDENLTVRLLGVSDDFTVTLEDARGQGQRPVKCTLTEWNRLDAPPTIHGFYLLRSWTVTPDLKPGEPLYQLAYFNGTNFMVSATDDGSYMFRFRGNPLNDNWAGITGECHKLLRDIVA